MGNEQLDNAERLKREKNLVPGVYEAPCEIEHSNIDKRYSRDWTKMPIKKGMRLVLDNRGDVFKSGFDLWDLSLENGRYSQSLCATRQAFWEVYEKLQPAKRRLSTIFHDGSWSYGPRAVLAVLVEQGKATLDEVEKILEEVQEDKHKEALKKHGV